MNYRESCEYLLSLGNEVTAMKLGLESMKRLLSELGDPQNNYLKVQVAGTNGKGSVCAFLEAICLSANLKIGVTTSPHLVFITERVRVNGKQITESNFASLATHVRTAAERLVVTGELETVPTYFEQVTAVALVAFADANVELAILETGLGGRLDATTAANAEIAVITRIDLDHQQYLGDTIRQIAAEKAAIIHPESFVVIGEQLDEAMQVILDRCAEFGIEPRLAKDVQVTVNENGFEFRSTCNTYRSVKLGLLGAHQVENATTAIVTAEVIGESFHIGQHEIERGLGDAAHPGRLEYSGRYLFDGAHNVGGAKALRKFLDREINRPLTIIFGAMNDKDVADISKILFPIAKELILTQPANSRAAKPDEIARIALNEVAEQNIHKTHSVAQALMLADKLSDPESVVLVTGSLYLVGEVKQLLNRMD